MFEKYLRGKNGIRQIDMDVNGNITGEYITEEPVVGADVQLTIDANIQAVAEKRGLIPQKHVDDMAEQAKKLWKSMGIEYDKYSGKFIWCCNIISAEQMIGFILEEEGHSNIYPKSFDEIKVLSYFQFNKSNDLNKSN